MFYITHSYKKHKFQKCYIYNFSFRRKQFGELFTVTRTVSEHPKIGANKHFPKNYIEICNDIFQEGN